MDPLASGSSIALVGVGAIGGAVIADLSDLARHHLQLCARTPFDALRVTHPAGESTVDAAIRLDPTAAEPVDWILLATKAYQSEGAKPWLDALARSGTRVAVLQNGVDHVARIQPLVATGVEVMPVVVQLPAEKHGPGNVVQEGRGTLVVPHGEAGRAFAALFAGGRTRIRITEDFITQAWWKLINNAALGAVCTLTLQPLGVAGEPGVRELTLALMQEVATVGRAEGASLPEDAADKALAGALAAAPDHFSSITVDRREGRHLEWQVRNAVIGERGRVHGIPTPLNDVMTTLLQAADGRPI